MEQRRKRKLVRISISITDHPEQEDSEFNEDINMSNDRVSVNGPENKKSKENNNSDSTANEENDDVVFVGIYRNATMNKSSKRRSRHVGECPICFEDLMQKKIKVVSTICGHLFCEKCIKIALGTGKKCPTCRSRVIPEEIHPIYL